MTIKGMLPNQLPAPISLLPAHLPLAITTLPRPLLVLLHKYLNLALQRQMESLLMALLPLINSMSVSHASELSSPLR